MSYPPIPRVLSPMEAPHRGQYGPPTARSSASTMGVIGDRIRAGLKGNFWDGTPSARVLSALNANA